MNMQQHIRRELAKLQEYASAADPSVRFDANETAFLERELTQQREKWYEVQYAPNVAMTFVPRATDIDPEALTYSTFVIDRAGRAKVIGNGANDIPRVDVKKDEILGKVHTIAVEYGFGLSELRTAARLGTRLEDWKGRAARAACDDEVDQMLARGETSTQTTLGVTGLVNNAGVSVDTTSFTVWNMNDTAEALYTELCRPASAINVTVKSSSLLLPDTMLLAPVNFDIVSQKRMGDGSDLTVLEYFKRNNPYIRNVFQWNKLATANAGGNGARALVYRKDPLILEGVVPLPFEQLPPQAKGLEITTICRSRAGGVRVYHPEAMLYLDHTA